MKLVIFDTHEEQAKGLQYLPEIPADVLYIFPFVAPGIYFHSRHVAEPFDIAFLGEDFTALKIAQITPPREGVVAPAGTAMVVEAKAGMLWTYGVVPGRIVKF